MEHDILPYVPDEETKIHSDLQNIYHTLVNMRKSGIFTLSGIDKLRNDYEEALAELLVIRKEFKRLKPQKEDDSPPPGSSPSESIKQLATVLTPTDVVSDEITRIISQMTDGLLSKISPRLYPLYAKMNAIHDKLETHKDNGAYCIEEDILPIQKELNQVENKHLIDGKWIVEDDQDIPEGQAILSAKLHTCYRLTHHLIMQIENLSPSMVNLYDRLVVLWKKLYQIYSKGNAVSFSTNDISQIQAELRVIDSLRHDSAPGPGTFIAIDETLPSGQAMVVDLLEACFELTHSLLSLKDPVVGPLREHYETLIVLRRELSEIFDCRHFWTLSGNLNDKYLRVVEIQKLLKGIDGQRIDGKFPSDEGLADDLPKGQAVLHFLLHKCYRLVYKILMHVNVMMAKNTAFASAGPDSSMNNATTASGTTIVLPMTMNKLMASIHRGLVTVRHCLLELKKHAPWSHYDLRPWKMKLLKYDREMRECKEQSMIVNTLWNECFDLMMEMEFQISSNNHNKGVGGDKELPPDDHSDRFKNYRPLPIAGFSQQQKN